MHIALFDLDHTLLPIDSDFTWSSFTNAQGWTEPAQTRQENEYFYQQYKARTLDMNAYVAFVTRPLRGRPAAELRAIQQQYARQCIAPYIRPPALDLLARHRAAGHALVLTTATNRFIAQPIGEMLGFAPSHILCTELQYDAQGRITGQVQGTPNLGAGKLDSLAQWLAARGLGWGSVHITFYSDSMNDLPLLEQASQPVATNPDARLRALAAQRGWPILDLFAKEDDGAGDNNSNSNGHNPSHPHHPSGQPQP